MNRFHVNVGVSDLEKSVRFYQTLFGAEPAVIKDDYAKWMLDDPHINFSINVSEHQNGINHVGIQAETSESLDEIRERLARAGADTLEQSDAQCCYARSDKTWVRDPDGVSWETFVTFEEIAHYGEDLEPDRESCCGPTSEKRCCVA